MNQQTPSQDAPAGIIRTLMIAIAVALVCSGAVTLAVSQLRPLQAAYNDLARNKSIVLAAGFDATDDSAVVREFLKLEMVQVDVDGKSKPVYINREDSAARFVFPVDAQGMWSTLELYVALEADLETIAAVVIHTHGETPGIGDRIEDPDWLGSWRGKRLNNTKGEFALRVGPGSKLPEEHQIDAISGATITSVAVGKGVQHWFSDSGYGPALAQLQ